VNTLLDETNLSKYPFVDQDFLNEIYENKWIQLSYTYNSLKTLRFTHSKMWNDSDVRIVHYILEKPWDNMNWMDLPEEERQKDPFNLVTTWWFQSYQDMLDNKINNRMIVNTDSDNN